LSPQNINQTGCIEAAREFIEFSLQDTEQSIAARFTCQAEKYPLKTAIQSADREITYRQLDQASSKLANAMQARWNPGEIAVAALLPQGIESITTMLAIFKAGYTYLPIDPSAPTDRDRHLLTNANVSRVVTNSMQLKQVAKYSDNTPDILNIDKLDPDISITLPEIIINPDTPALILYTSGSTGQPKGVVHSHRTALHNVLRHTNAFYISHRDRQTQLYQVNAYAAMRDTLNALLNGASLHMYSVRDLGVTGLATWLREEQITLYCSPVSVFRHLAHTLTDRCDFPDLRLIKLGGEITYKTDIQLYQDYFPTHCQIHCGFSSTETGVARHYFANNTTVIHGNAVPLGYACETMKIRILDKNRQPVQTGESGEIAVKSRYVALGYWQQNELSTAAFIKDKDDSRIRTYLTGDVGFLQTDGCLVHQGRKDFQVKIRGNRVDIIEIEQTLLMLGHIKEAAVVVRKNNLDENELVAFCVCTTGMQIKSARLREVLSEKVPAYMIPVRFEFLDSLPLTQSGKLNRKVLQERSQQQPPTLHRPAPQSPIEKEIATIWKTLLQIDEEVGIHDNFFESGGHSLLATRLISQINDRFNISLPMRSVFISPDIYSLGMMIFEQLSQESG